MGQSLTNKVVLITGASSGIGLACAHAFADAGAKLIITARRLERLQKIAEELPTAAWGFEVLDGDASDLRFLDKGRRSEIGAVIGLKAKGKARHDKSGFVQYV